MGSSGERKKSLSQDAENSKMTTEFERQLICRNPVNGNHCLRRLYVYVVESRKSGHPSLQYCSTTVHRESCNNPDDADDTYNTYGGQGGRGNCALFVFVFLFCRGAGVST